MTQRHPARSVRQKAAFFLALSCVAALASAAAVRPAAAQDSTRVTVVAGDELVEVRLADGSVLIGRIVEANTDRLVILTQGGTRVEVDRAQVVSVRPARGRTVDGEFWPEDPNATRLFFGPTARSLPQGRGYFGVFELLFPMAAYGITDRFTLGAGTIVAPEVAGEAFVLAPKLEVIRTPQLSVAFGALAGFVTEEVDEGSVGLVYGVGTLGNPDRAVTLGAFFPFYTSGEDSDVGDDPGIQLGGEFRTSRRTKLITENYFVPAADGGLLSGGIRFFGDRLSADFGLGFALDNGDLTDPLPIVNFVYVFGKR